VENALAYLQVSTTEQAREGVSLDAQEERVRAYSEMSRLNLVNVVREDGISAAKALASRPGGQEIVAAVNTKRIGHVVALKLDRLCDGTDVSDNDRRFRRAGAQPDRGAHRGGTAVQEVEAPGLRPFRVVTRGTAMRSR